MDLLSFLKEKKGETIAYTHPFAYYDNTFKYLYCFGLGVLAYGHMKAITETKRIFEVLLEVIKLHPGDKDRIIIDINNNFDYKITEVFKSLDTKEKQYAFTADLIKLSNNTLWAQVYCENVTNCYMSVFQFSKIERSFLAEFISLCRKNNVSEAVKIYHEFIKLGYHISYGLLKYISGEFLIEESYENLVLEQGETVIIDRPTTIHGKVVVKNGSSLIFDGAEVKINGSIQVDSGRLSIRHSNILVLGIQENTLFHICNSALVKIEDAVIDCNFKSGMLYQKKGHLIINNSKILHTKFERAIVFEGVNLTMNGTDVEDALAGGLSILNNSVTTIDDCNFYHCESEHGGAIYSNSMYDTKISNCRFRNCNAKYIGGAVYFLTKKYGQVLYGCEIVKCLPKDSNVFNDYLSENNIYHFE